MAATESSHIRMNKEDRANLAAIKKKMVKLGIPETSISVSDVIRFAMKKAAEN